MLPLIVFFGGVGYCGSYVCFFARLWLVIAVSERLVMDSVFCIALVLLLV